MNDADWPEVRVSASGEADARLSALEEWLGDAGALSVTLIDRDDADAASGAAVLEPLPGETRLWRNVTLVALFAQGTSRVELDTRLRTAAERCALPGLPEWSHHTLADAVWERAWMDDYRPMRFGERLTVAPHGVELPDPTPVVLRLDPGLAFGTGTHPTTALCLHWLDAHAEWLERRRIIDYGAGSGVLAIAALLLGAEHAYALDIDPQAHLASRDNALRNGVADRLDAGPVERLDGPPAVPPCDLLLANILHGPLMELAEALAARVADGGRLVLSGLLESQSESLRVRYTPWFDVAPTVVQDGWARLDGVRRPRSPSH